MTMATPEVVDRVRVVGAIAVAGYLLLCAGTWSYTMDDAFISFRYAKHIGDGLGPIWNLADRARPVEGFTSFGHVWLLGLLRALSGSDLVLVGKTLGIVAGLILAISAVRETRRRGLGAGAAAVALSFLVVPFTPLNAVSGMETSLFMLWNWLCAIACLRLLESPGRGRAWAFALLGLLGTLTRPEFLAVFGALALYAWWRCPEARRTLVLAVLVADVLPALAITAWRFAYYGEFVPNPFFVKQRMLNQGGALYVLRFLGLVALPYLLLAAGAWRRLRTEHRDLVVVVGVSVGVACAYFTTTKPMMGWWYRFLLSQVPLLALLAGVAWSLGGARWLGGRAWRASAVGLLVLSLIAHAPPILWFLTFHEVHEVRYREIGRRLRPFAAADRWLAYWDVGSIVYESEWNTLDVVGLNTHRRASRDACVRRVDVLLHYSDRPADVPAPCPNGLYVPIADLPFSRQALLHDGFMRVYVRSDVPYAKELRAALQRGWPERFSREADWLSRYWARYRRVFFQ
jgi:hypothetical protein